MLLSPQQGLKLRLEKVKNKEKSKNKKRFQKEDAGWVSKNPEGRVSGIRSTLRNILNKM